MVFSMKFKKSFFTAATGIWSIARSAIAVMESDGLTQDLQISWNRQWSTYFEKLHYFFYQLPLKTVFPHHSTTQYMSSWRDSCWFQNKWSCFPLIILLYFSVKTRLRNISGRFNPVPYCKWHSSNLF
jgi:hypothetical protein